MTENLEPPAGREPADNSLSLERHETLGPQPTNLIDAFYVHDPATDGYDFVGVVGREDGSLGLITRQTQADAPTTIQDQLAAVDTASRGEHRAVTTPMVSVMSVAHIEQGFEMRGLNDPVILHGTTTEGTVQAVEAGGAAVSQGQVQVGRLDLLHSYRQGVDHAFRSLSPGRRRDDAYMIPMMVPARTAHGEQPVMAYPAVDAQKTFSEGDNSFVTLLYVYDLLTQLQHDVREEGLQSDFADQIIPAPSRRALEAELTSAGYHIDGDEAVKLPTAAASASTQSGLLDRLRRRAAIWSADRVPLPPQATHQDYANLIDQLEADPAIYAAADRAATQRTDALVEDNINPATRPRRRPAPAPVQPVTPEAVPSPPPPAHDFQSPPQSPAPVPAALPPEADWKSDFLKIQAHQVEKGGQDWGDDFAAVSSLNAHTSPAPIQPAALVSPHPEAWANDFAPAPSTAVSPPEPKPAADPDWKSDFEQPAASRPPAAESAPTVTEEDEDEFAKPVKPTPPPTTHKDWEDDFK